MTSGGDLCHVEPKKLICETNRRTVPCVMQFLLEGYSKQTDTSFVWEWSEKYTSLVF